VPSVFESRCPHLSGPDRCNRCSRCSGSRGSRGSRGPLELALPLEISERGRRLIHLRLETVNDLLSLDKQCGKLHCLGEGVLVESCGFTAPVRWDESTGGRDNSRWSSGSESTTANLLSLRTVADVFCVAASRTGLEGNGFPARKRRAESG